MEKTTKLYAKFLEVTKKDKSREKIIKKFDKIFKNIEFDYKEDKFNKEFLTMLFKRKGI